MRNGEGLSMEQVIAFIENAPANIFFKDTSCRYRAVSEACALINGKENFDIIGKPMSRFGPIMKWANVTT